MESHRTCSLCQHRTVWICCLAASFKFDVYLHSAIYNCFNHLSYRHLLLYNGCVLTT